MYLVMFCDGQVFYGSDVRYKHRYSHRANKWAYPPIYSRKKLHPARFFEFKYLFILTSLVNSDFGFFFGHCHSLYFTNTIFEYIDFEPCPFIEFCNIYTYIYIQVFCKQRYQGHINFLLAICKKVSGNKDGAT